MHSCRREGIPAIINPYVPGGKAVIQGSFMLRYLFLIVVLFAGAKSGFCNVIALVLPLVFTRPILTVGEFFRKSGENKS